ncbi:Regulator of chromosome condensation [Nymphon striatum]|nr:Regulator of chromosome condensation [Nymphon striatum]
MARRKQQATTVSKKETKSTTVSKKDTKSTTAPKKETKSTTAPKKETKATTVSKKETKTTSGATTSRKRGKDSNTSENSQAKRIKLQPSIVKGHLLSCGQGDIGQLGQGEDVFEKTRPGLVIFKDEKVTSDIVDIAAGGMHSVCLTSNGNVYTFGCNDEGALGRVTEGEEGAEFVPRKVSLPCKIVQITAGDSHTAALSEDGIVYLCGTFRDSSGKMGLISPGKHEIAPIKLIEKIRIVKIESGSDHLVCLSEDGDLYTCGCAEQGQLGRVAEYFASRGGRRGVVQNLAPARLNMKKVKGKKLVFDDIWTGPYATYAKVKETNEIFACGLNNYLQLGLDGMHSRFQPEFVKSFNGKNIKMIGGGQHHTIALDSDGKAYALGRKEYGRLGLGENCEDAATPTIITTLSESKCHQVDSGVCVSFAVDEEGKAYSWGMGTNSQLGHGDDEDRFVPTQMNSKMMTARKSLKVCGGGQHTVILALNKE